MNEYKVVLKFANEEIFRGFFVNTTNYRIVKDEINLEEMIEELIEKGSIKLNQIDTLSCNDYSHPVFNLEKTEVNDLDVLFQKIQNLGYETIIEENKNDIEIIAIGKSLHPDIISQTDENRVSKFSISMFKSVNNKNYEPPLKKVNGSFKVKILDEFDKEKLEFFLHDLKNGKIQETMINKIEELTKIDDLELLKINISDNKYIEFTKEELKNILSKQKKLKQKNKTNIEFQTSNIRSLDNKNLSFKIDLDKVIFVTCKNEKIFNIINDLYFSKDNKKIKIRGYYKLERSFICEEIIETKNF